MHVHLVTSLMSMNDAVGMMVKDFLEGPQRGVVHGDLQRLKEIQSGEEGEVDRKGDRRRERESGGGRGRGEGDRRRERERGGGRERGGKESQPGKGGLPR
eukprot:749529-Hanusia_phi.AAC.1